MAKYKILKGQLRDELIYVNSLLEENNISDGSNNKYLYTICQEQLRLIRQILLEKVKFLLIFSTWLMGFQIEILALLFSSALGRFFEQILTIFNSWLYLILAVCDLINQLPDKEVAFYAQDLVSKTYRLIDSNTQVIPVSSGYWWIFGKVRETFERHISLILGMFDCKNSILYSSLFSYLKYEKLMI
ncbi:MAG: hypothetical protein VKL59_15810 [Nostocaceae cyanobacterium]|nr:hypothetical protein [Nostocaceae cyanobacterium]